MNGNLIWYINWFLNFLYCKINVIGKNRFFRLLVLCYLVIIWCLYEESENMFLICNGLDIVWVSVNKRFVYIIKI